MCSRFRSPSIGPKEGRCQIVVSTSGHIVGQPQLGLLTVIPPVAEHLFCRAGSGLGLGLGSAETAATAVTAMTTSCLKNCMVGSVKEGGNREDDEGMME